jgi:hypothetical protein
MPAELELLMSQGVACYCLVSLDEGEELLLPFFAVGTELRRRIGIAGVEWIAAVLDFGAIVDAIAVTIGAQRVSARGVPLRRSSMLA